jgi:predicted NUDIX family NTP pyrophosphohydrolase
MPNTPPGENSRKSSVFPCLSPICSISERSASPAWAAEGELDLNSLVFGAFTMEWPRGSGRFQEFPEIDRVAWFVLPAAREKVIAAQRAFLDRLADHVATR